MAGKKVAILGCNSPMVNYGRRALESLLNLEETRELAMFESSRGCGKTHTMFSVIEKLESLGVKSIIYTKEGNLTPKQYGEMIQKGK